MKRSVWEYRCGRLPGAGRHCLAGRRHYLLRSKRHSLSHWRYQFDCYVNFADVAQVVSQWLECSDAARFGVQSASSPDQRPRFQSDPDGLPQRRSTPPTRTAISARPYSPTQSFFPDRSLGCSRSWNRWNGAKL